MNKIIIEEGMKARFNQASKDENPYEPCTMNFISWLFGWTTGQEGLFN